MAEKKVDSYRFLHGVEKRMLRCWANLPRETQIPWTPFARPLSKCNVSLVSSAGIALKTGAPFDLEIETQDPWFADPSYRVLPQSVRTGDIQVCHRHINPTFAERDLNSVLPTERLQELAELGEIGGPLSVLIYGLHPSAGAAVAGERAGHSPAASRGACRRSGADSGLTRVLLVRWTGTTRDRGSRVQYRFAIDDSRADSQRRCPEDSSNRTSVRHDAGPTR